MTRVLERARTLSLAPSQSCYYPQGLAARSYVVNRLDTDLTTKLARCLRRRDDNWPTLSMTGTHTITNRRQNSLREAILPVFISCVPSCKLFARVDSSIHFIWGGCTETSNLVQVLWLRKLRYVQLSLKWFLFSNISFSIFNPSKEEFLAENDFVTS